MPASWEPALKRLWTTERYCIVHEKGKVQPELEGRRMTAVLRRPTISRLSLASSGRVLRIVRDRGDI